MEGQNFTDRELQLWSQESQSLDLPPSHWRTWGELSKFSVPQFTYLMNSNNWFFFKEIKSVNVKKKKVHEAFDIYSLLVNGSCIFSSS